MNIKKKLVSLLLASAMVFNLGAPLVAMADDTNVTHTHSYTETVVKPTCTEKGYTLYTCACQDSYKDNYVDALNHDYYATDTGEGTHRMVCRNDDSHSYEEGHEWSYQDKILPTCTTEGYTIYKCGKCQATQNRDYVPALDHDYTWIDNENGSHTGICTRNKNHVLTEYCKEYYHDYVTPPTCIEQGYTSHICDKCGYVLVDSYLPPVDHNYAYTNNGDGTHTGVCKNDATHIVREEHIFSETTVEPTCTSRGYTTYTCKCGYSYDANFVPATTHKYVYTSNNNGTHTGICDYNNAHSVLENCEYDTKTVAPTCENQGYDLHTCTVCGYSYKDNYVKKLGHDWMYTYNDNGTHTKTCRNDSTETYTEKCETVNNVVAPTCTTVGYTEHSCELCGAYYKDSYEEKLGHDYVWSSLNDGTHTGVCTHNSRHTIREGCDYEDIVTKPTCTTNGYTTHKCKACGYSYIDSYVPMLGHIHVYEDLGSGTHRVTCKNDPYEINIIEDHKYTVKTVSPTCEERGYDLHECSLCGNNYKDNYTNSVGHNYVYYADNNQTHTGICIKNTSHTITLPHVNADVVVSSTCESDGYTTHTCKICGHTYTDNVILTKGHDWTSVVTKPTCATDGYTTHTCKTCGKVVVDSVVKTPGHQYSAIVTAPTCTSDGYTTYSCRNCGHTYKDNVEKATGHTYTWVVDKEAEVGVAGSKHEECTCCGNKKAAVIIAAKKSTAKLLPVITKSTKNSQTLTWNTIPDAEYYKVYGTKCDTSYVFLKNVRGTSWTRTGLKKKNYYKYYVVAINKNGSKEVQIEKSISVHATTTGGTKKNPTKVTVKNTKNIKLNKSSSLGAKVSDSKVSRHVNRIRYVSSDTSIATVNSSGKVTGKKKGTCYIYVIAQNGLYKKVKVTIK